MDTTISSRELWNKASVTGLLLALVTIAFLFVADLCAKLNSPIAGALMFLVDIAKIVVCIVLFRYFLVKLKNGRPNVIRKDLYSYGIKIALCSSILVAGYNLLDILVINPNQVQQAIDSFRTSYAQFADSNTLSALDGIEGKMPIFTFIFSWIWCFVWGWALSSIFSRNLIPSPFDDVRNSSNTPEDQNQN